MFAAIERALNLHGFKGLQIREQGLRVKVQTNRAPLGDLRAMFLRDGELKRPDLHQEASA
jgi:hypothetical protein